MKFLDPVCKMELDEKDAKFKAEFDGRTYHFCNLSDKKKFEANPKKYLES